MAIEALFASWRAGRDTGLLERLPGTLDEVVGDLDRVAASRVLAVLVAAGVVRRDGPVYLPGPTLERDLRGPRTPVFEQVESFLRTGELLSDHVDHAAMYPVVVPRLAAMFEEPARQLADVLDGVPGPVLDLGTGAGIWGLSLAGDRDVTGVDRPAVLERFRERAKRLGVTAHTWSADLFADPLPEGPWGIVLIGNVVHLFPRARATALVVRAASMVGPSGRLVIVDAARDGIDHAAYALHLGVRLPGAFPHTPPEIASMMHVAGFEEVDVHPLSGGLAAMVGRR